MSHHLEREWAQAGDRVELTVAGVDPSLFSSVTCLCDPENPIPVSSLFRAQIVVFDLRVPILAGSQCLVHFVTAPGGAPGRISKLISTIDKKTGNLSAKKPRSLTRGVSAIVEISLDRPICIELYADFRSLGRFTLRDQGKTFSAGIVTKIFPAGSAADQPSTTMKT